MFKPIWKRKHVQVNHAVNQIALFWHQAPSHGDCVLCSPLILRMVRGRYLSGISR